jgi:4-hydroxy 2-oxovalerate aldolase
MKIKNIEKKYVNLLDCTLRDGGYYNNWNYDVDDYKNYIQAINNSGITYVEVGFRFDIKNQFLGPFAFSTDYFVEKLGFNKKIKLALMINCSDLIKQKKFAKKYIDQIIKNKKKSPFKIIRFAAHFDEIPLVIDLIKYIRQKKYKIFVNLMQISNKSELEIIKVLNVINKSNSVDVLYFADSLGAMKQTDIGRVCGIIKKFWKGEFGIHAHNNCGLALKNSIKAIRCGATWVDSTILGMGRGAGNTRTEELIRKVESLKRNLNFKEIDKCIKNSFLDLKKKFKWGPSKTYVFAAANNIHPTYVQVLENEFKNDKFKILEILKRIKNTNLVSYNPDLIKKFFNSDKEIKNGGWNAKNWCNKKNLLIIGKGESLKKYKNDLVTFIKIYNPLVISLNFNNFISEKFVDYFIVSNQEKLILDYKKIFKTKKKIIIPKTRFNKIYMNKKYKKNFFDYGLQLTNNKILIKNHYCEIPSNLVLFYSLALAKIGNCNNIYLTGFDGYGGDDPRDLEISQNFIKFEKMLNKKIISITPTNYNIKKSSLYAFI